MEETSSDSDETPWLDGEGGVLFQANLTQVGKSPSYIFYFCFEGLSGLLGLRTLRRLWSFIRSVTGVE